MDAAYQFQPKDWVALAASLAALSVSFVTYRQKSNEGLLAQRKQLTDLLEKLSDLTVESEMAKVKKADYPPNYGRLLNDKKRFLVRQASFLMTKVKGLTSPYEYLVVGAAYGDLNDSYQAESFYKRAINSAGDRIDKGIAQRAFGRHLFRDGKDRHDEARSYFEQAIESFRGGGDRDIEYVADTYNRWAGLEEEWGNSENAAVQKHRAITLCRTLSNPKRRTAELRRLSASEGDVKPDPAQHKTLPEP